ncbi:MAG: acid shock protein, partial [Candidatus Aenigmatarchaeota archaeon]
MNKVLILIVVFALLASTTAFAAPNLTAVSPTPANFTNQSSTSVTLNITSSLDISLTRSALLWTNQSGQISDLNLSNLTIVNGSLATPYLDVNYTYITINGMLNGTHSFTFRIGSNTTDDNMTLTINITVDNANPPTATVTNPINATNTTNATPNIEITLVDSFATVLNYTIYANGVSKASGQLANNTRTNVTLSALTNGTYLINVEAVDQAGTRANSTPMWYLTVDTLKPVIVLTSPGNTTYGRNITLSYVAADAHTALAYCWYVNSSNFRKNLTCNSTITFLSDYKNSLNNITL